MTTGHLLILVLPSLNVPLFHRMVEVKTKDDTEKQLNLSILSFCVVDT